VRLLVDTRAIKESVVSVELCNGLVVIDLLAYLMETLWAEILHVVSLCIVQLEVPLWLIKLVRMIKVEGMCLKLDWQQSNRVDIDDIEARRLTLESCA